MILSDDGGMHVGWLETTHGLFHFSIIGRGRKDNFQFIMETLNVDVSLRCLLVDLLDKVRLQERLQLSRSPAHFAAALQDLVNDMLSTKPMTLHDSFLPELLMNHLETIGWNRVVFVNEDFNSITLRTWDSSGREHVFDIYIPNSYPITEPAVQAIIPDRLPLIWLPQSNLRNIVEAMDCEILKLQTFFNVIFICSFNINCRQCYGYVLQVISDVDSNLSILEPLQPTFATTKRRIAIERACSVIIDINPDEPTEVGGNLLYFKLVKTLL